MDSNSNLEEELASIEQACLKLQETIKLLIHTECATNSKLKTGFLLVSFELGNRAEELRGLIGQPKQSASASSYSNGENLS